MIGGIVDVAEADEEESSSRVVGGGDNEDKPEQQQQHEEEAGKGVHYHFQERVSGKSYSLIVDDYIEDHNYDEIPHIHGDYDDIKLFNKFTITSRGKDRLKHVAEVFTVISSCFLTYTISNHEPSLPAVISQAVVIMMSLVAFPEMSAASAAGAFAGMANSVSIINYGWLCLLSIVVSVMWLTFNRYKLLVGYGGRIGTCAFISMNIVSVIAMLSGKVPWTLYGDINDMWAQRLELTTSILSVIASAILCGSAGAIRLYSRVPLNPIQAPTILVLFCMLILEPATSSQLKQISNGLAVGGFVSMASTQNLPTVLDFTMAGFAGGLFLLLLSPFFEGFGGRDGFSSFCGFSLWMAVRRLIACKRTPPHEHL